MDFQNLASKAAIINDITLIDQFSLGIDQGIATMNLSMIPISTTINNWIEKAKTFHIQKMCIKVLRSGHFQSTAIFIHPQKDPNTMDVDSVNLSKLTPIKCIKCIREGCYFHCRKTSHNATTCHTSCPNNAPITAPHPQNICHTKTTSSSQKPPTTPCFKLDEYVTHSRLQAKVMIKSSPPLRCVIKKHLTKLPP